MDNESTTEVSPDQQLEAVWSRVLQHNNKTCPNKEKQWPHYKTIMDDITNADYTEVLKCPHDMVNKSRKTKSLLSRLKKDANGGDDGVETSKAFCAHGTAVCAKIEMFSKPENSGDGVNGTAATRDYTGLLSPGQSSNNCMIRLSSAMKPPAEESNMFGRYLVKATGGKLKHAKLFPMVAIKAFRDNGIRSGNLLFAGPKIVSATLYCIPLLLLPLFIFQVVLEF